METALQSMDSTSVLAIAHCVVVKPSNTNSGLYILPADDEAVTICPVTGIIELTPLSKVSSKAS